MNFTKNSVFALFFCSVAFASYGGQEASAKDREITSATIEWKQREPQEIVGTAAYKRWVKDFGVIDARLAKELDYTNHSIRYVYMDVTNDGRDEIVVQEGQWAARGYAFAIFELQGKTWKTIAQHRGAFILRNINEKKPYEITLIDKDERYDLSYIKNKYKLKTKIAPYEDMSYEYFWSLNHTKSEQCQRRNFSESFIANELCKKSPS
jgi:hypothetical protein